MHHTAIRINGKFIVAHLPCNKEIDTFGPLRVDFATRDFGFNRQIFICVPRLQRLFSKVKNYNIF